MLSMSVFESYKNATFRFVLEKESSKNNLTNAALEETTNGRSSATSWRMEYVEKNASKS